MLYQCCKFLVCCFSLFSLQASGFLSPLENLLVRRFSTYSTQKNFDWLKNSPYDFNKDNFNLLLENKIPAIRIKGFASQEESFALLRHIKDTSFSFYENVYPPIGKIGITQFEHSNKEKSDYFKKAVNASKVRDKIFFDSGINVLEKLKSTFLKLEYDADIAYEQGEGFYFAGLIRQIGSADLHFDYAPYDAPKWFIGDVRNQIAWNLYVDFPKNSGGECVVYNKIWQPEIYSHLISDNNNGSYGFKKDLVKDTNFFMIKPCIGDLWFFNSRNFHEVLPSEENNRVSISSFIGQTFDQKKLFLWS